MADTRKDKRALLSVKIRYKSGSLAEFVEHYSSDISRGGVFIRAKSPLPIGTLLKFEFQLRDESPLIHGVGRVIWKRNESEAGDDHPSGMGIKFIKMDEESRARVQQIVDERGIEEGTFESGDLTTVELEPDDIPTFDDRTAVRDASEFVDEAILSSATDRESRAELQEDARRVRRSSQTFKAVKEREDQTPVRASVPPGAAYPEDFDDDAPTRVGEIPSNIAALARGSDGPDDALLDETDSNATTEDPSSSAEPETRDRSSVEPSSQTTGRLLWWSLVAVVGVIGVLLLKQSSQSEIAGEPHSSAPGVAIAATSPGKARVEDSSRTPVPAAIPPETGENGTAVGDSQAQPTAPPQEQAPSAVMPVSPYAIQVITDPAGARVASGQSFIRKTPGEFVFDEMPKRRWLFVRKSGYERLRRLIKRDEFVEEGDRHVLKLDLTLTPAAASAQAQKVADTGTASAPASATAPVVEPAAQSETAPESASATESATEPAPMAEAAPDSE